MAVSGRPGTHRLGTCRAQPVARRGRASSACPRSASKMPRVRWTPEEEKRLLALIAAGKSWMLISVMIKRSMKSVKLHAKTLRLVGAKRTRVEGNQGGETARA